MKYLLPILCLFIYSCDNDSLDGGDFLEFTIPNSINNSWTYRFTDSVYLTTMTHDVVRTVIDPSMIPFNYENNCNLEDNNIIYIFSEGINFEENFGSNLGNDCSHSQCGATSLVNIDYFSYSAYNLDSEMFRFCSDIYEINEETQVQGHAYVIFNNIELDFPIYTGKTWTGNIEDLPGPYIYEVLSLETLTVNIQNEPMIFDAYKIGVFHDSFAEMVFYLSPIGILKISYTSHDMEITNEYHETGEFFNHNVNVELIDYDI